MSCERDIYVMIVLVLVKKDAPRGAFWLSDEISKQEEGVFGFGIGDAEDVD